MGINIDCYILLTLTSNCIVEKNVVKEMSIYKHDVKYEIAQKLFEYYAGPHWGQTLLKFYKPKIH